MADPINDPEPSSSVEQTYAQVRDALPALSPEAGGDVADVIAVAPGVRMVALRTPTLPPAAHTNCYVVGPTEGRGALVLIDPGSPYPDQQAKLDAWLEAEAKAGRRAVAVVLTHHHGDHTGGAAHLQARWKLQVAAHALTARLLAARVKVDLLIEAGELTLGDLPLRVHHTPGHAIGHVCVQVPSAAATAVGDMVAGLGTILIDPDEGDMIDYLASLRELEQIEPGALLPAHGPVIADGVGKLREYRAHRLRREDKIAAALAERPGVRAEELVPLAYADTPAPFWPLAVRSTLAHLEKLRREGRAVCDRAQRWT